MTHFRCVDGPYRNMAFTEPIHWERHDVMKISAVHYYQAGWDGDTVLLTAERPDWWERDQRNAFRAQAGVPLLPEISVPWMKP